MATTTWCTVVILVTCTASTALAIDGIYVSNGTDILYSSDGSNLISVYHKKGSKIVGLAYDWNDRYIFWSEVDPLRRGIYRATLNGASSVTHVHHIIYTEILAVNGLAVDYISNNIYWTDGLKRSIEVADYDGRNRLVLNITGLFRPRGIVFDSTQMRLYWNDQGTKRIETSDAAGGNRRVLVDTGLEWPNQMVLMLSHLCWVDAYTKLFSCYDRTTENTHYNKDLSPWVGEDNVFGLAITQDEALISVWNQSSVLGVAPVTNNTRVIFSALGTSDVFSIIYVRELPIIAPHPCDGDQTACGEALCLPTGQTPTCACPSFGGKVLVNGNSCVDASSVLLYASADDGYVGYYATQDNADNTQRYLVGRSLRPAAVAFDSVQQMVYWSDVTERTIHRARLNGSDHTMFLSLNHSLGIVDGLVVDEKGRRLYYTNMGSVEVDAASYSWHKIESVSLSDPSGDRKTIVDTVEKPRGLFIANDALYYTDWGSQPRVVRVSLDGSAQTVIRSGLDNPNAVVVSGDHVYVIDSHYRRRDPSAQSGAPPTPSTLYDFYVDSGEWRFTAYPVQLESPFGMTYRTQGDHLELYVSEMGRGLVKLVLPGGPSAPSLPGLVITLNTPLGVLAVEPVLSTAPSPVCTSSTCESDEVCLLDTSGEAQCSCNSYDPKVRRLNDCQLPDKFLLVSDMNSIKMLPLDGTDSAVYTLVQGGGYFSNFAGLAYNAATKQVFFSDVNLRQIYRYNLNNFRMEVFFSLEAVIDSMTINSDRLYWTNFLHNSVESIALSGENSTYRVLVSGLSKPRGIQVDQGNIYWTEWGMTPRVARRSSTGQVTTLVSDTLVWPNAIVIDNGAMYIGDGKTMVVTRCELDGSSCLPVTTMSAAQHIFDMSVKGRYVVYSDWDQGTVSVNVLGGRLTVPLITGLMRPTQMYLKYDVQPTDCPLDHGCSDQCISVLGRSVCQCLSGRYMTADMRTCRGTSTPWVPAMSFMCSDDCLNGRVCANQVGTNDYQCKCQPGRTGSSCMACSANQFKSTVGEDSCQACPAGSLSTGGLDRCSCSGNQRWDWNTNQCVASSQDKTGECPYQGTGNGTCLNDNACYGAQKCCPAGSARACMDAVIPPNCVYRGEVYRVGEAFAPDVCVLCVCDADRTLGDPRYGGATCSLEQCPRLACDVSEQTTIPGMCCPTCGQPVAEGTLIITNCPSGPVTVYLNERSSYVNYLFQPNYLDPLRRQATVVRNPAGNVFDWRVEPYEIVVTVRAGGDHANCTIFLYVADEVPPVITCPADQVYYTSEETYAVQLPSPTFSDNVGIDGTFKSSVEWGTEKRVGQHHAHYRVNDLAGLSAHCTFHYNISSLATLVPCGAPPPVENGQFLCDLTICALQCAPGYTMGPGAPPQSRIMCQEAGWVPPTPEALRRGQSCVQPRPFKSQGRLLLKITGCGQGPQLEYTGHMLDNQLQSYLSVANFTINQEVQISGCAAQMGGVHANESPDAIDIDVRLYATYTTSAEGDYQVRTMNTILSQLTSDLRSGALPIRLMNVDGVTAAAVAQLNVDQTDATSRTCLAGEVVQGQGCLECAAGTYASSGQCVPCAPGTFQERRASVSCTQCPADTHSSPGAFNERLCVSWHTLNITTTPLNRPPSSIVTTPSTSPTTTTTTTTTSTTTPPSTTWPTQSLGPTAGPTTTTTRAPTTTTTTTSTTSTPSTTSSTTTTSGDATSGMRTPPKTTSKTKAPPEGTKKPNTDKVAAPQESQGVSTGVIVAVILVVLVVIVLVVVGVVLYRRYKTQGRISLNPFPVSRSGGISFDNAGYDHMLITNGDDDGMDGGLAMSSNVGE